MEFFKLLKKNLYFFCWWQNCHPGKNTNFSEKKHITVNMMHGYNVDRWCLTIWPTDRSSIEKSCLNSLPVQTYFRQMICLDQSLVSSTRKPSVHISPEMMCALSLSKTTPGDNANTRLLQQFHTIEEVWLLTKWLKYIKNTTYSTIQSSLFYDDIQLTFAFSMAFWGILIWGNAYIAPMTSLHLMPSIESNASATILARSFNDPKTAFFSLINKG